MLSIRNSKNSLHVLSNLNKANSELSKSIQKISSGDKIQRALDAPAQLAISEKNRTDIASMKQAQENNVFAISILQTAEGTIAEITSLLNNLKQTILHAANEAVLDDFTKQADIIEIEDILASINNLVETTRFSKKNLLTGENSSSATIVGEGLSIIETGSDTLSTPDAGLDIDLYQMPTKSSIQGRRVLNSQEERAGGIVFKIIKDGQNISYTTKPKETKELIQANIQELLDESKMDLTFSLDQQKRFHLINNQYGSRQSFIASTSVDNLLTQKKNQFEESSSAKDIAGMVGQHFMRGDGELLIGNDDSPLRNLVIKLDADILKGRKDFNTFRNKENIDFNEEFEEEIPNIKKRSPQIAGIINIQNNSMIFQDGADQGDLSVFSMKSLYPKDLAQNVKNESNFKNLSEIQINTYDETQDALKLVHAALEEVILFRGKLGSLQKNEFESQLNNLDNSTTFLRNSNSEITDADIASEVVEMTKYQLQNDANIKLLSQVNQDQESVLSLLA